jgi:hypothetical protein
MPEFPTESGNLHLSRELPENLQRDARPSNDAVILSLDSRSSCGIAVSKILLRVRISIARKDGFELLLVEEVLLRVRMTARPPVSLPEDPIRVSPHNRAGFQGVWLQSLL